MARGVMVVTGNKELNRKLSALTGPQQKKVVRSALRPALKPVQQKAKQVAKSFKDTGLLARSIKIRSNKRSRRSIGARVTSGTQTTDFGGKAYYGAFQEYGWKSGKRGSGNRRQIKGKGFMQRAVRTKSAQALRIYNRKIYSGLLALI